MAGQAATAYQATPASSALRPPVLTGRERELALLGQVLEGPPAVVLVEGEAGIGKTRLIQEFLSSPAGQSRPALVASCPPYRQPHTLGPVADALRQAVGGGAARLGLSALAGALRPLFPEWATVLPPLPEPLMDVSAARHRVFGAVDELLDRLGVQVLVVEDAHWADEATLELLLFLAAAQPRSVTVLVTSRAEDVPSGSLLPRLARQAAGSSGVHLTLSPLGVEDTARLVSSMLAGEQVTAAFAEFLHQRTEGVPLAVEESVRVMADRADLIRRDGGWARRHLEEILVPRTVRDAVLERMARLSQDAQAVLQAAAVLAGPVTEALLAVVAELAADEARAGLCEALECSLLTEDRRGLASFRHVLACQAVYDAIPGPRRRLLHRRAGLVLESSEPPPVVQLARHFREAGETGKWSAYAGQVADLALASGDEATALAVLCDLIAEGGEIGFHAVRQLDKTTFASVDEPARYGHLISEIRLLLASGTGSAQEAAQARFQLGRLLRVVRCNYGAGNAELKRAILNLGDDAFRAARAATMLGWPFDTVTQAAEHRRWLDRAAQLERSLSPHDQRLLSDRATALLFLGEESGWALAASIPADSAVPRERQAITVGCLNTGELAMIWGRYADARQCLARAAELARRYGHDRWLRLIAGAQVHLDWLTGSWDGLAARAQRIAGEAGTPGPDLDAALIAGLINMARGEHAAAEQSLRAVADERQQRGEIPYLMEPVAALARLHLAGGRSDEALQVTDEPMALIQRKGVWLWGTDLVPARVDVLVAAGQITEASGLASAFARGLRGRDAPGPLAGLAVCRAILAAGRGDRRRAAILFARSAEAWQALPRPYEALLARERQARCLIAADRRDEGVALLTEVFNSLSELGADGDAERVRRSLRENGGRTWRGWRGGRRGYGDQLSPRELEVVRLLVAGHSRREIADALFRSPKTVDGQVRSAMRKLGVSSRSALAAQAIEAGLTSSGQRTVRP